jgi:hypothetical protein
MANDPTSIDNRRPCRPALGVNRIVDDIEMAVHDLHPVHRLTTHKLPLAATRGSFGELKNLDLQTDLGKLDCIGEVSGVGPFETVLQHSETAGFSYGMFPFLSLDALIASQKVTGRERDLAALRHLLAIKEKKAPPGSPF